MSKKAIELRPWREFLKLAALIGAAALAGKSTAAGAEQAASPAAVNDAGGEGSPEFLLRQRRTF